MKNVDVKFRTIAYGFYAVAAGVTLLKASGVIDDIERKVKNIQIKKPEISFKKKEKKAEEIIENPVIKDAISNTYYSECFRHGGYKGNN